MRPYPSYKDSGVKWIGKIPKHWKVRRVTTFGTFSKGRGINRDEVKTSGIPCIRYGEIYTEYDRIVFDTVSFIDEESSQSSELVKKGDVLFTGSGETIDEIGKTVVYYGDDDIFVGGDVIILKLKDNLNPSFISYMMNSKYVNHQKSSMGRGEIVVHIYSKHLKEIKTTLPPLPEQKQIGSFLDHKTQKIDELIKKTEKKVELLKEKRTSLINQCVTKGLNPNVEMKDSGVEWIGEIPSGWELSKFNFYVQLRHGYQFRDYDFTDEGIRIIKITQLHKNGYLDISNCSFIDNSRIGDFTEIVVRENDILMCLTGGTIGKIIRVGKVNEPLLQNYRVGHFSPKKRDKITDDYLFWLMSSDVINGQIFYEIRETGQPNIGMEDFTKMKICLPPLSEQQQIVEYIDEQTKEITTLIDKETQRIELLKEYRQSFISEVVTGKIDVRDEVVV